MLEEKPCAKNALKREMARKGKNEQQEWETSEIFRRFLQEFSGEDCFGGESLVRHSRSVLRIFSRELPERLYHSERHTSHSTVDSVSGTLSPAQNASAEGSPKGEGTWGEDSVRIKQRETTFKKALIGRCFSDGLVLSHPDSSLETDFYSGEIMDLELESKEGDSIHQSPKEERREHSPRESSIYRVMTSTTVAFPTHNESVERLNAALREDRMRRISADLNKVWPPNVTSYLKGIDLFLKIPEYVRPPKRQDGLLNLTIGSCSHPHPSKAHYGGEDAHFYEENAIGVADGVGEWANFGINPKAFANELISGMREAYLNVKCMHADSPPNDVAILRKNVVHACDVEKLVGVRGQKQIFVFSGREEGAVLRQGGEGGDMREARVEAGDLNEDIEFGDGEKEGTGSCFRSLFCVQPLPQFLLMEGYKRTRSFGSSTAFVACFDPVLSKLSMSYLGDSGVIILRRTPETFRMGIVYRSPAQQHSFNCPFQLSRLPTCEDFPELEEKGLKCFTNLVKNGEDIPQDLPSHSISKEVSVFQSDLIVVGTDGLFDNLFDYEICSICSGAISPYEAIRLLKDPTLYSTPHHISKALANAAYSKSLDPKAKTPFSRQSVFSDDPWQFSSGGKLDDITVVVAWVICEQDQDILNSECIQNGHIRL